MQFLKQSTAAEIILGPAVAVGDGFTPVITLSLATADEAEIMKHQATSVTDISGVTLTAITGMDGYYRCPLTTSHTDTLGQMTLAVNDDSLILPIKQTFMVVTANVWDSLFSTDYLQIDVVQLAGDTGDATNLKRGASCLRTGTVQASPSPTTTAFGTGLTTVADQFNGRIVTFTDDTTTAALRGQSTDITDTDASGVITVTALTTAPVTGDIFVIS